MANVIIGTDLKSLVKIDRIGQYEMKDMDFTIDVIGTKTITFTKEECARKQRNGRIQGLLQYARPRTQNKISLRHLVDGDFKGRKEKGNPRPRSKD